MLCFGLSKPWTMQHTEQINCSQWFHLLMFCIKACTFASGNCSMNYTYVVCQFNRPFLNMRKSRYVIKLVMNKTENTPIVTSHLTLTDTYKWNLIERVLWSSRLTKLTLLQLTRWSDLSWFHDFKYISVLDVTARRRCSPQSDFTQN